MEGNFSMELTLMRQVGTRINAICDGQLSHSFDLRLLLLKTGEEIFANPVAYGKQLYEALFPPHTPAHYALATLLGAMPGGLLLVTGDDDLDAIPWEYAYGPDGFLVQECHVARGLSVDQRLVPPTLDTGMHIIAVPSNPLSHQVESLNLDGEWLRLKETIQELPFAITLERTRPPSLERLRQLVATHRHRVVHFMGHGGQDEKAGAILCFEKDIGDLDSVTAKDFMRRVRGTVFLVTLNACASATPGPTAFNNLAAALVRQKVPYALGMRFSIVDEDARAFSRTFYSDLARGASVEEALRQARLTLAKSPRPWAVGVPVLYTSLTQTAAGFAASAGSPTIQEQQPHVEVSMLSRAEGTFQGRTDELKQLGTALTGDNRPPLITIHGGGGQGKTALAREAVERFAYAWPGGVWAISLENLPSREVFVNNLARFLGIAPQEVTDPSEMERRVLARLGQRRTLIVLDNAETLVEGVEADNVAARRLAQFIREQLPRPPVSLLVTSRSYLRWSSEIGCELEGLAPMEGIRLFLQSAPQRMEEINPALAWELSQKVDGHPLSLHLLSSAFNAGATPFSAFVEEYEAHLLSAENKYKAVDHRHRTLYASIETSIRYLDAELRALLSGLWLFHAPFLPETAAVIFDRETENSEVDHPLIYAQLNMLWQRGLLSREMAPINDQSVLFYRLQSTVRSYIERYLEQYYAREILLTRFKAEYRRLVDFLTRELDQSAVAVYIAQQTREDLEWGRESVASTEQASYLLDLGGVIQQLGDTRRALELFERVLEYVQGQDSGMEARALGHIAVIYQSTGQPRQALALHEQVLSVTRKMGDSALEAAALNNMGLVYLAMGQPQQALTLLEQALAIVRKMNNRESEAKTVNGIAEVYRATGQPQRALALYEQALFIMRELANRRGEAVTLNNMGLAYHAIGQPQRALELYEQALPIRREMSDWAGEADTLNNMGLAWRDMDQAERALLLFEQALPIRVQVGDRRGESTTLSNIGLIYSDMSQSERALQLYEQALSLSHEV